ncbi:hypothetical protein FRC01_003299 [Tulasnella sp. 417]|nr:hypothetical protein FRC01_003299 [Tulasnella sp. 417]
MDSVPLIVPATQDEASSSSGPAMHNTNRTQGRLSVKRKKVLVSLLNEIVSLKDEDFDEDTGPELPTTADDRLQNEGAALFNQFNKRVCQLDEQLLAFGNAVRPLGSSVSLISSLYNLQSQLQQILHLFRENASSAFPSKIKKDPAEPLPPSRSGTGRANIGRLAVQPRLTLLTSDLEELPHQFELLAEALIAFLILLPDIPEFTQFTDESLNTSVLNFEGNLKYWASCLSEFEGQFGTFALKRYINGLTKEVSEDIETIRGALERLVNEGVPMIKVSQVDAQNGLLNMATVATFVSGIAATTLQYISDKVEGPLPKGFHLQNPPPTSGHHSLDRIDDFWGWICFELSVILSLKGRAATYRSPRSAAPLFVSVWLRQTPLLLLAASILTFSGGLLCYVYSSFQGTVITECVTALTCITSLGPFSVAVWFGVERFVEAETKGHQTPIDIMREWKTGLLSVARVSSAGFEKAATWSKETLVKFGAFVASAVGKLSGRGRSGLTSRDAYEIEEYGASPAILNSKAESMRGFLGGSDPKPARAQSPPPSPQVFSSEEDSSLPVQEQALQSSLMQRIRFKDAVTKVRNVGWMKATLKSPTKDGQGTHHMEQSHTFPESSDGRVDPNERSTPPSTRLAGLVANLKALRPTQELFEHGALVRHLQFSPDGKWLATCSWDRKAIIWKVGTTLSLHRVLVHTGTGFLSQVAWSPDGKYLLTRIHRHVKVWLGESGVLEQTISYKTRIGAVTWMPQSFSFACVEGGVVHIMDLQGKILADHTFERLDINDIAVTHDEQRMILVATLQCSKDNLRPIRSKAEKRIIVYHLIDKRVEYQVPVLGDVRAVTISIDTSNGYLALVSYEIQLLLNSGELAW